MLDKPLAKGAAVEIRLMLPSDETLTLGGEVVSARGDKAESVVPPPGVTIKYDRVTNKDGERLHAMIKALLLGDFIANRLEAIIKPD